MEQQPATTDQPDIEQTEQPPDRAPTLTGNEVLFLFLACMVVGFVGVLTGFVPLVALAMIGPVVITFLT